MVIATEKLLLYNLIHFLLTITDFSGETENISNQSKLPRNAEEGILTQNRLKFNY